MKNKIILIALCAATLSGCQGVKNQLGVGRNSPDEFTVVKRAPLSLPPDYELRPPMDGTVPPASRVANQAEAALTGQAPGAAAEKAGSDDAFLAKTGAADADPNIRRTITQENGYIALENTSVADKLIFWKKDESPDAKIPSSVVDPAKEAERIKQNEAEGKPVNDGTVPVIEKKQSTIDKLF